MANLRAIALLAVAAVAAAAAIALEPTRHVHPVAVATPPRCEPVVERLAEPPIDATDVKLVAPVTTVTLKQPLKLLPSLHERRYVFPVLGPYPPFYDTFGAPRPGVDWHHGDDLFAPRGTPLLAVANGVVFSVGWNRLGGWRLWLVDDAGNEFYYAHLERYSALAVDGRRVIAGQVLGYVGNTGDAENTPPHLHFEIHPTSLLKLGYDGAVDPTSYLHEWHQLTKPVPMTAPLELRTTVRCVTAARRRLLEGAH
jgi:murein DD-endopeptidase MepM/ murein hydrolase activator NlpD